MRILSGLILFFTIVWVTPTAAQLPCGEPLTFVGGLPVEYPLWGEGDGGEPWTLGDAGTVLIYQQGYVTLEDRLDFDPASHPRALEDLGADTRIIAPFWLAAARCEGGEPPPDEVECARPVDAQGRVEAMRDAEGVHITWFGLVPECVSDAPRATFSLSIAPPDESGHNTLTFRYHALEWAGVDDARLARAGVHVGGAGSEYELFVNPAQADDDEWSGAGKYPQRLLEGGGGDEPGVWVIELGPDGRVVGDDDGDGIRDDSDNCPRIFNPVQVDTDSNGEGDACGTDDDGDTVDDEDDNCPVVRNPSQADYDGDGIGDACDGDADGDEVIDVIDNCDWKWNPVQADLDGDGAGDVCDLDVDGDGRLPVSGVLGVAFDRCQWVADPLGKDGDGDGIGDACDMDPDVHCGDDCAAEYDSDGDGISNVDDLCPRVPNPNPRDTDQDGVPDACDADADNDGLLDIVERLCPDGVCSDYRPPALGGLILLGGD